MNQTVHCKVREISKYGGSKGCHFCESDIFSDLATLCLRYCCIVSKSVSA